MKLADAPVAAYEGDLRGLRRTAPDTGKRLDNESDAVRTYLRHLEKSRNTVLDSVPGVKALYEYEYTLNGFAARLTGRQASKLARTPGVTSVTRSTLRQLASAPQIGDTSPATSTGALAAASESSPGRTTSAPMPDLSRFLGLSGKKGLWSKFGGGDRAGEGMIIGMVDTGFDPRNPLLAPLPEPRPDEDIIARKWKGSCDKGNDSAPQYKVTCNNKVIGAAWFHTDLAAHEPDDVLSPLDTDMHGTHTGTTAAGNFGVPATIPGADISGTISGVAPAARLAVYKACWSKGCGDADTAAAIDRAVADGVDVISYSIGGWLDTTTSLEAMFNAAKAGVFVAAAAGNGGPGSVENTAPWITTVAAETHDTGYTSTLVLGNGRRFAAPAIADGVPTAPLVNSTDARRPEADLAQAANCAPGTLDSGKARGKIIVCDRGGTGFTRHDRYAELKASGAVGMVLLNTGDGDQTLRYDVEFPTITLGVENRNAVRAYASDAGATASFAPPVGGPAQARVITDFSAGGPETFSGGDLLKPDIAAPGELVPAGTVPGGATGDRGWFGLMGGTSAATPQISGLATLLKSLHPGWSPMEIKSALMTTATTDTTGEAPSRRSAEWTATVPATPLDFGAGSTQAVRAADPGLVYDSTAEDWTAYLCATGVRLPGPDETDACAGTPQTDPSDLNYPTISVGDLFGAQTVSRTVRNASATSATYQANLRTPPGYKAEVSPKRLTLASGESATYKVTFTRTQAPIGQWSFGALTWSDAHSHHRVTSTIALRGTLFDAPKEVSAVGQDSITLTPHVGWAGTITARAELHPSSKITGTLSGTDQSDFPDRPPLSDAVAKTHMRVPEGASFTRVAITAADHLPGSDLDLYVFDEAGERVSPWPGAGSDEHADLPPGDYEVYVLQFETPQGVTEQPYTLRVWKVGQGGASLRTTTTPASQRVGNNTRPDIGVSWAGAERGETYVGVVGYGDGSKPVGRTVLTVRP